MNEENSSGLKDYLGREVLRHKDRTPEQKQALKEQGLVPGILFSREESEEFLRMSPDEREEKVKELNQRLAESPFVGPPHIWFDDE